MPSSVLSHPSTPSTQANAANTIAVLLGWAHAKDEHLAKFSAAYERRGLTSIRFTSVYRDSDPLNIKESRDVSGLVDNLNLVISNPDTALIFHIFSVNGICTFCSLILQYPHLKVSERIVGIVFDSCPIYSDKDVANSVIQSMDLNFYGKIPRPTKEAAAKYEIYRKKKHAEIMKIDQQISEYRKNGGDMRKISEFHYLLDLKSLPKHISVAYSDSDTICKASMITEFHEALSRSGHIVDVLHLADSAHVEHYRNYPLQYEKMIDRLLSSTSNSQHSLVAKY